VVYDRNDLTQVYRGNSLDFDTPGMLLLHATAEAALPGDDQYLVVGPGYYPDEYS
jgi:hypothetical protein